jgi:hypothetical protein
MKLSYAWRRRLFLAATILLMGLLLWHPELRLFAPVVDALGFDVFAVLVGAQLWTYARPVLHWLHERVVLPAGRLAYTSAIFMLGLMGPYVDAKVAPRCAPYSGRLQWT